MRIATIPSIPRMPSLLWRGVSGGGAEPPAEFARAASTNTTMSIHSGHSLTDAYVHTGPWPGSVRNVATSIDLVTDAHNIIKSTIPGSPLHWRWNNAVSQGGYDADARRDADGFDSLVITEGGPPPHVDNTSKMADTLDYLCRFAANQIVHGAGNEVILWTIWPSLDGPGAPSPNAHWTPYTFRSGLPEYGRSFKHMADYTTWKMRQLYPQMPEDWRVWIMPGHLWMARVYDDIQAGLVPGVTAIQDLFGDDIHTTSTAGYGLACFVITCLYQIDLRDESGVYIQPEFTDHRGDHPAVTQAQAEYFWRIAWEIATAYEPIGMGGTEGAAAEWTPDMGDPLPDWDFADYDEPVEPDPDPGPEPDPDPEPEPGDLPKTLVLINNDAAGYAGPSPAIGTIPALVNGVYSPGERTRIDFQPTREIYVIYALRINQMPENVNIHSGTLRPAGGTAWSYPSCGLIHNGYTGYHWFQASQDQDATGLNPEWLPTTDEGWIIFEGFFQGTTIGQAVDGGSINYVNYHDIPSQAETDFTVLDNTEWGQLWIDDQRGIIDTAFLSVAAGVPTEGERAQFITAAHTAIARAQALE